MKIATITLANPTVFAPLAGITDLPMRLLAKEAGCALVYTEMVSANALVFGTAKTIELLRTTPEEKPLAVQLFGGEPAIVAEAARRVVDLGADIVDLNCGCAVKKILKSGSGVALMQDSSRAAAMFKAVRTAITIPLTIKLRAGWDGSGDQALALGCLAQDCGVDAVALHPRTARQGFGGHADWRLIARLKAALSIPVIGNGDITSAEDALAMREQTGCDAVMVGRAAIGNPFIFTQVLDRLAARPMGGVSAVERLNVMRRYADAMLDHYGEIRGCRLLRSRLAWFAKGLPQAVRFRQAIRHLASKEDVGAVVDDFTARLTRVPYVEEPWE